MFYCNRFLAGCLFPVSVHSRLLCTTANLSRLGNYTPPVAPLCPCPFRSSSSIHATSLQTYSSRPSDMRGAGGTRRFVHAASTLSLGYHLLSDFHAAPSVTRPGSAPFSSLGFLDLDILQSLIPISLSAYVLVFHFFGKAKQT